MSENDQGVSEWYTENDENNSLRKTWSFLGLTLFFVRICIVTIPVYNIMYNQTVEMLEMLWEHHDPIQETKQAKLNKGF